MQAACQRTQTSLLADDLIDKLPASLARYSRDKWLQLANHAQDAYQNIYGGWVHPVADKWLKDYVQPFAESSLPFDIDATDADIVEYARVLAARFERSASKYKMDFGALFTVAGQYVSVLKIFIKDKYHVLGLGEVASWLSEISADDTSHLFKNKRHTPSSVAARLKSATWWVRQMRKMAARELETIIRNHLGFVHRRSQLYVSNEQVRRRREQKARNAAMLSLKTIINEMGEEFQLDEVVAGSNANPMVRRAELMVRIAGFEHMAQELDHIGEFITLTCPSRFHAHTEKYSQKNPKFDGSTPIDAQAYLNQVWARIGAALSREKIKIYGFRVTEPHHDGCPHWHGLFFMEKKHQQRFRQLVALHGCREDRKELKLYYKEKRKDALVAARQQWEFHCKIAKENNQSKPTLKSFIAKQRVEADVWRDADYRLFHQVSARVLFKAINWNKGTAAGYIAKYIAKNIDGKNNAGDSIGGDYESEEYLSAVDAAVRVDAWSATWGIRQFQQIGGAPVTVWRELRRLRVSDYEEGDIIEQAAVAADVGDWGKFTMLMGGIDVSSRNRPIKLYREDNPLLNVYGEQRIADIQGVVAVETGEMMYSRFHEWTVVTRKPENISAGVLGFEQGVSPAWTCVNNSTKMNFAPKKFSDVTIQEMMKESTKLLRHFDREEITELANWVIQNGKVIDYQEVNKEAAILIYADMVAKGPNVESQVFKCMTTQIKKRVITEMVDDQKLKREVEEQVEVMHGKLLSDFEHFEHFYNAHKREARIIKACETPFDILVSDYQLAVEANELAQAEEDYMRPLNQMAKRSANLFDVSRLGLAANIDEELVSDYLAEIKAQKAAQSRLNQRLKSN